MFQTSIPGKWILTGEHTVLRGERAIVFPLISKTLRLRFMDGGLVDNKPMNRELADLAPKLETHPMLKNALSTAAKGAQKFLADRGQKKQTKKIAANFQFPMEKFSIESMIPIGSGLGSSAALCVALAKWFAHKGYIYEEELFDLALEMEHAFHGKSSGMDVAVALSMQPLEFRVGKSLKPFLPSWQPNIYLFDSGERSSTKVSVTKVMDAFKADEAKGRELDLQMKQSVDLAYAALCSGQPQASRSQANSDQPETNLKALKQSFEMAQACYKKWDLITPGMAKRAELILRAGAIAWKPTGSGAGGFLLALFPKPIPEPISDEKSEKFNFDYFSGFANHARCQLPIDN